MEMGVPNGFFAVGSAAADISDYIAGLNDRMPRYPLCKAAQMRKNIYALTLCVGYNKNPPYPTIYPAAVDDLPINKRAYWRSVFRNAIF